MGHIDEHDLNQHLLRLKAGDSSHFSEFYALTKSLIYYTILPMIKDVGLTEDLMQDVYIKVIENIQRKTNQGSSIAYLLTIARNIALNELKKRQREQLYDRQVVEMSIGQKEYIQLDPSPIIQKMYRLLSDIEIEIVTQHVLNDLSFKEISQMIKQPLGTVLWRYNQAIKKLQKGVNPHEND